MASGLRFSRYCFDSRQPFGLGFAYERYQLAQIQPLKFDQIYKQQGTGCGSASRALKEKSMAQNAEYGFGNKRPIVCT